MASVTGSASTAAPMVHVTFGPPFGFAKAPYSPGETVTDFADSPFFTNHGLDRTTLTFWKLSKTDANSLAIHRLTQEAVVTDETRRLLPAHTMEEAGVSPGDWLLAVVTSKSAASSSATGKCPHSIVFPSVARSSLTWSRCFVSPLLWLLVQEVQ
jgi:hypothetical protein